MNEPAPLRLSRPKMKGTQVSATGGADTTAEGRDAATAAGGYDEKEKNHYNFLCKTKALKAA